MSTSLNRPKRRSADQWGRLVQECLDGSYKKTEFCKERGLNYAAFMFQCARMRKKSAAIEQAMPDTLIAMKLVTAGENTLPAQRNPALCSLTLKNGMTLHIHDQRCFSDIISRLIPNAAVL